jgi:hypothetical protein
MAIIVDHAIRMVDPHPSYVHAIVPTHAPMKMPELAMKMFELARDRDFGPVSLAKNKRFLAARSLGFKQETNL